MPSPNRSLVDDPISISRPREPTSNNALQPVGLCRNAGNWRFSRARLPHRFWLARAELARGSPLLTGCVHDLFLACSVSKMEAACPCVRVGVRDGHPRACKGSRQAAWRVRPTKGTAPFPARPDVCEPRACLCPVGRSAPVPIPPPRRPRHRLSSPRRHRAHRPAPRRIAGSPLPVGLALRRNVVGQRRALATGFASPTLRRSGLLQGCRQPVSQASRSCTSKLREA